MLKLTVGLLFTLALAGVAILGSNNKICAFTAPGLTGISMPDNHACKRVPGAQKTNPMVFKRGVSSGTQPPPTPPPTKPTNR
jgi:hypothetical protein